MARISGVNIPKDKKVKISLTYVFGIGNSLASEILDKTGIDPDKRVHELTEEEERKIQIAVQEYRLEGDLRRAVREDINRLKKIGSYRGFRHKRGLPVRGQRTKTNARTRKGRKRAVAKSKKTV
jgi:small subunit ribosomal protein S13